MAWSCYLCKLVGHFFPIPGINFGTVGVNLFFVLSGLLMGGFLFRKNESIGKFYRRRIARIFPAHILFIFIISLAYFFLNLPFSAREFLAALLFLNNYISPEGGPGSAQMPLNHIWSLSVEEHSYITLSLVAVGCRRGLFTPIIGVSALLLVTIYYAIYYQWLNPLALAFSQ